MMATNDSHAENAIKAINVLKKIEEKPGQPPAELPAHPPISKPFNVFELIRGKLSKPKTQEIYQAYGAITLNKLSTEGKG